MLSNWGDVLEHATYLDGLLGTVVRNNSMIAMNVAVGSAILNKALNSTFIDNYIECMGHGYGGYKESSEASLYGCPNNTRIINCTFVGDGSDVYSALWIVPTGGVNTLYPISGTYVSDCTFIDWRAALRPRGYQENTTIYNTTFVNNEIVNCSYVISSEFSPTEVWLDGLYIYNNTASGISTNYVQSNTVVKALNQFYSGNLPDNWGFVDSVYEPLVDVYVLDPTPTDSPAKETASNLLNALLLWGVVPFAGYSSVIVVAVKKGLV